LAVALAIEHGDTELDIARAQHYAEASREALAPV